MRRWNGWGNTDIDYPVHSSAVDYLSETVGPGGTYQDISIRDILKRFPTGRLPRHPLVSPNPVDRLRHARGQSFPDWLALRHGLNLKFPDGVAYPTTDNEVNELIQFASSIGALIIPYGGGTSVVGHINPVSIGRPVLTIDLGRMNRLHQFDATSQLATFGAGIAGPDLEAQLRAHRFSLGHFPQSFEFSTLGGWIATRSSGQQSFRYGRIEEMFAGGILVAPVGRFELPVFPASAAGPDLKHIVLGSEGRLGIITEATMRVTPVPERENFHAVFFPEWDSGFKAVREISQSRLPLSMMRYSTARETQTTLVLAGHENLISVLESMLAIRGIKDEKCMLLLGFSGSDSIVKLLRKEALAITGRNSGIHIGRTFGSQWHRGRFKTPYLRNTLWEMGYGVDTLETAVPWDAVKATLDSIESALQKSIASFDGRLHVFSHLSHFYPYGSSIYTTYIFRLMPDPEQTYERWFAMKTAASQAILNHGGTITHQHGIGTDHVKYLPIEKGQLGMKAIKSVCEEFDPEKIMNPGKLFN